MAARKISSSSNAAAAKAVAVAVVAVLVVAATAAQDCRVNRGQVMGACMSYCGSGSRLRECCGALRYADVGCLCRNYWGRLKNTRYAGCARDIQAKCGIGGC